MQREVLDDIAKQESHQRKDMSRSDAASPKKEVDFAPHSPPQVHSKNVTGPPVYYPPGSAEFTKKEYAEGAMSQSGVSIFLRTDTKWHTKSSHEAFDLGTKCTDLFI